MRPELNEDFVDVLHELQVAGVEFVIVGAPESHGTHDHPARAQEPTTT